MDQSNILYLKSVIDVVFGVHICLEICYAATIILLLAKKKYKWILNGFQDEDYLSVDSLFSHAGERREPLKPPVRKALAMFSGKRNPNDNHFSRRKVWAVKFGFEFSQFCNVYGLGLLIC